MSNSALTLPIEPLVLYCTVILIDYDKKICFCAPPNFASLVFRMVEAEEEYVDQLETLITTFARPFKMAASSKSPPCTHEDLNSIFLNAETVLFLHQIFLKGLTARMESWPTLVLGTSLGARWQGGDSRGRRTLVLRGLSLPQVSPLIKPIKNLLPPLLPFISSFRIDNKN